MANKKISDLTAGSALTGTELIEIEQSSTSKYTTPADLKTYVETNPTKITSPVAWTPTCTGFGTVSALTAYSWRFGSLLFFEITFTAGTTTATEARVSLGYNGTNNNVTTVSTYPTLQIVGLAGTSSSSGYGCVVMAEPSKQYIVFGIEAYLVKSPINKQNGNEFANSTVMSIQGSVRIDGW